MAPRKIKAIRSSILLGTFLTGVLLAYLNEFSSPLLAQEDWTRDARTAGYVREYDQEKAQADYNRLLREYGSNKNLPEGFELQALIALSHYPRLKNTKINFIVEDVSIPLSSRPHWSSMLRAAENRTYQVIIDSELEGQRDALLLKNQPFNAQIGILGHELAHTVYYLDRSFLGIASDALCQFTKCRIDFERATDSRLIEHGLGWQRFDHATFVRGRINQDQSSAFTAEGGGGAYMSPAELLRIMESIQGYELEPGNP